MTHIYYYINIILLRYIFLIYVINKSEVAQFVQNIPNKKIKKEYWYL